LKLFFFSFEGIGGGGVSKKARWAVASSRARERETRKRKTHVGAAGARVLRHHRRMLAERGAGLVAF
jgi:hypothetical protein